MSVDADARRRPEARWIDVGRGDDDIEGLVGKRFAADLHNAAVVLEQRGAVDEHQRSLDLVQPAVRYAYEHRIA